MFTRIESGFSNLDETVNFGNRIVGETKELCEICTLAVIPSENTQGNVTDVTIRSCCKNGMLFFSIGNVFRIMKDKEISEQVAQYVFESDVQTFVVSPCENYILICTVDGNVVIRKHHVSKENLFQYKLDFGDFEDATILGCFSDDHPNFSFYIVATNGLVFKISWLNTTSFEIKEIANLKTRFTLCSLGETCLYIQGLQMSYLFNLYNHDITSIYSYDIEKVYSIGRNFLVINKSGKLCFVSSENGILFELEDAEDSYDQLIVLKDVEDNSKINLVVVTKPTEELESQIQLMTFPEFEIQYSIKAPSPISLMDVSGLNGDVLFFWKIFEENYISEIRLQCVYEADPVLRVERLNKKRRFDEAMKFAEQHGVDREMVLKAKAEDLIGQMACTTEDVEELLNILEQISEKLFRLNCCFLTDCKTGEDARRVLLYCSNMEIGIRDTLENRLKYPELEIKEQINQKLFKLDTYMAVYQKYDCERWNDFFNNDLLDEMILFLQNENIEGAIIICNRLDINALKDFNLQKVEDLLNVFDQMSLDYVIFLTSFIPVTLKNLPSAFTRIISWLHERVYLLEDEFGFPEVAIKLIEDVVSIINKSVTNPNMYFQQNKEKLIYLLGALRDLRKIQEDFGIRVALREFIEDPADTIKFLLRAEMSAENFELMMNKFLCPFMSKIGIDRDEVLLNEIKCLLGCDESNWINIMPIMFKFITKACSKLAAIEAILEAANIPWSDSVRDIAKMALTLPPSGAITKIQDLLKNEQRIMVMNKYQIRKNDIKTLNDIEFYTKKLLYINNETAIQDILALCRDHEDVANANITMIRKFIEREDFNSAMKILDSNLPNVKIEQAEKLLNQTLLLVSQKSPGKYDNLYFKASKLLADRIVRQCNDTAQRIKCQRILEDINATYGMRKDFGVIYKLKEVFNKRLNKKILDEQILNIALAVEQGSDLPEIFRLSTSLALYLKLSPDEVLVKFMSIHDNFQVISQIATHLYETVQNSKTLSLAAILMFKYLKTSSEDEAEETFLDVTFTDVKNEDYLQSIKLARKLAIKSMIYATTDDHSAVMEVMRWVNSCYYLTNWDQKLFTYGINSNVYIPKFTTYPFCNALETIKKAFIIYCFHIEKINNPNTRYLTYFNGISESTNNFNEFFGSMIRLIKEDQHITAYNMIKTLQMSFCYDSLKNTHVQNLQSLILEKWLPQTLEMALSAGHIDMLFFLNLLLLFGKDFHKPVQRALASYKRNPSKVAIISKVSLKLTEIFNISDKTLLLNYLHICKWWQKLNKGKQSLNILYENFFRSDHETRLEHLISEKQLDLSNIAEYCKDFNIGNTESAYLKLFKITLLTWKPEYDIIVDDRNQKKIQLKSSMEKLFDKCWEIVLAVQNKKAVFELTEKIWSSVNFYYYEVFLVLVKIQVNLSNSSTPNGGLYRVLLQFLNSYIRVAPPTRSEIEHWCATFQNSPFIDPLSEYRLPLNNSYVSNQIWDIIKPEVNLNTYMKWFELSHFCQHLNQHDICSYAIHSVLKSGYFSSIKEGQWDFDYHEELITKVDNCAKHITDLEKATAAVYNLMCGMPSGADKVKMAELSYKYALMLKKENPTEEVEKIVEKVKIRYHNFSAMHILHKYNLAEKDYLMQVTVPGELILNLYKDNRILKKFSNIDCICPDINRAVDDLATFFKLDKNNIKYTALIEHLSCEMRSDLNKSLSVSNKCTSTYEIDSLKRACYICSDNKGFWQNVLCQIGFKAQHPYPDLVTAEHKDFAFKANALKCLYYVSNSDTVYEMTGMDSEEFLLAIEKMNLISKINNIGILLEDIEHLDSMPKNKLLKDMARINYDQTTCVRCMAKICKIYTIDDMKYWEYILNTATKLGMVEDLLEYVEELKFRNVTEAFKAAWRLIILHAFSFNDISDSHLENSNDQNESDLFVDSMRLLQSCPVLYALDIEYCIEKCISKKKFEFAAVLLQYLPREKVKFYNEQLPGSNIFKNVQNLRVYGIVGINQALDILSLCH